jgi:tetratricopeptide (TPR) repeat protein
MIANYGPPTYHKDMGTTAVHTVRASSAGLALLLGLTWGSPCLRASEATEDVSEEAAQAIARGDLDTAQSLLQSALKSNPRSARLHKLMATVDFVLQRFDAMRDELHLAIECGPNDADNYLNLGMLELGQSHYSRALPPLQQYVRLKPNDAQGHLLLGHTYLTLKTVEAEKEFRAALALDPRLPMAHQDLGFAEMNLGRRESARDEFLKEIEVNPDLASSYLRAGTIELDLNHLAAAEALLRQAVNRSPDEARAHFELGRCLLKVQKPDEAEAEFRKAIALDSRLLRAHYGLGQALQALGKKEESQHEFALFSELTARDRASRPQ